MRKASLKIADNFTLPLDFVTQASAILARRGAGKTYTAAVMAEELIKAHLPVVILDPMGAFWGLRASADGKRAGLPITILGGEHGDLPLEPTAGRVLADFIVEHPGAYILDMSAFESNAAQDRFVTDFAERLYRLKAKDKTPLHLIVDEADSFAPQRPQPGQQRMLGAFEAIVRRGRIRGMGVTLITQRPASLNKNVLTQAECLVVLQMTAPQDRKAIDAWVEGHGTKDERDTLLGSLAGLKRGQAWFWSPAWLEVFQKVQVRRRTTFDSSATPKPGEARIEPQKMAEVDLKALHKEMAATIERQKADDPKMLRQQLAEMRKQFESLKAQAEAITPEPVEVPVITPEAMKILTDLFIERPGLALPLDEYIEKLSKERAVILDGIADIIRPMVEAMRQDLARPGPSRMAVIPKPRPVKLPPPIPASQFDVHPLSGSVKLGKAERAILTVLAQYQQGRSKTQLALMAGYSHKGGAFNNALGSMRSKEYVRGGRELITITDEGMRALGPWEELPAPGLALLAYWQASLGKAERTILGALYEAHPEGMSKADLGVATEYESKGGAFNNALGKLRTLELIQRGDPIHISPTLVGG